MPLDLVWNLIYPWSEHMQAFFAIPSEDQEPNGEVGVLGPAMDQW